MASPCPGTSSGCFVRLRPSGRISVGSGTSGPRRSWWAGSRWEGTEQMAPLFIFDLDNTLYPPAVPLWRIVDARIERYVQEHLGTDPDTAHRLRKGFLAEFGTTLRGLMHHHDVRPGHYLEYVHDVPVPEIVPPRPELREMLAALPGRRVVFTNGSGGYAGRVLDALGVSELMDGIYGIEFMEYVAKPSPYP